MRRRLVVSIDGTNNAPGLGATNVQRLNRMLVRSERQLLYYQPGVGTVEPGSVTTPWGRRALMLLDSMSALMLRRHVCSAYRFLMSEYRDGDELYFFGFSRGAYAVRVLAGMLGKLGLLHRGQDEMVGHAWRTYAARDNATAAREFRNAYGRYVPRIRFLGLFDTVSAVGTPWRPRTFDFTFDNAAVTTVRHAVSLDEHRAMFVPNLWDAQPTRTDVQQVWFAGAHADVGGGYAEHEAGLSLIPLDWMAGEARRAGLALRPRVSARLLAPLADPALAANAPAHDELARQPAWQLLEMLPIPRWRPAGQGAWIRRWRVHLGGARRVPSGALVHASVQQRVQQAAYRPRPELAAPQFVATPREPDAPPAARTFGVVPLGDCLWIEYGDATDPRRILVDCGGAAASAELRERCAALPPEQRELELLVVATGARERTPLDLPVSFKDEWIAADEQLAAAAPSVIVLDGGLTLTLFAAEAPGGRIGIVAEHDGRRVDLRDVERDTT